MTQQNNVPNLYQLAGDGIQITYTLSNSAGQPQLDYQDSQGSRTFSGDQVRSEQSPFGTLVTVFLSVIADGNVVTLTLLLPSVNLAGATEQPIETLAIRTTNRSSFTGPPPGAGQVYQVYNLQGTAQLATATTDGVMLSVDAASYSTGDTIVVTLSNQISQTIFFNDHLTNCTIIQLQRQVDGNWVDVNPCRLEIPTRMHTLDAGQSSAVELYSATDIAGLYRATLIYRLSAEGGPLIFIQSPEFQVG